MKLNIEINAAEGGDDAVLLVEEQARILSNHVARAGGKVLGCARAKGWLNLEVQADDTLAANLAREAGGHRWQRVPPTERRGRVHSSTVTVAVSKPPAGKFVLQESELEERFKRSTGPGGQHRNKSDCCCVLTHLPTGISVTIDSRSQADNRRQARVEMERRLRSLWERGAAQSAADDKRRQVGSGQRGDKVRTYSAQHGIVTDHRSGRKAPLEAVMAGKLELLS